MSYRNSRERVVDVVTSSNAMETIPKKRDVPMIISIERVPDNLKKKSIISAESDITQKDEHKKAATLNQISVTTKTQMLNREQNALKNYDGRREENPTSYRSKGAIPKAALSDVDIALRKSNPRKDTRDESQKNELNDIEKSTKIKYLQDMVNNLSQALSDKDLVMMDLLSANIALQKNAIEELMYNKSTCDEFDQIRFSDMISNLKNLNVEDENGAQFAIGYERKADKSIWLPSQVYDSPACISKIPSMLVKNIATAVFGCTTLRNSSVTGKISNTQKGKCNDVKPRPKLETKRLEAIKDILCYWLWTAKNYNSVAIDLEASQVGKHVSQKIYELNRVKDSGTTLKTVNNGKRQLWYYVHVPWCYY